MENVGSSCRLYGCDYSSQHHQFREKSSLINCKEQLQGIGMLAIILLIGELLTSSGLVYIMASS